MSVGGLYKYAFGYAGRPHLHSMQIFNDVNIIPVLYILSPKTTHFILKFQNCEIYVHIA